MIAYVPATCEYISGTDLLNFICCHTEIDVAGQTEECTSLTVVSQRATYLFEDQSLYLHVPKREATDCNRHFPVAVRTELIKVSDVVIPQAVVRRFRLINNPYHFYHRFADRVVKASASTAADLGSISFCVVVCLLVGWLLNVPATCECISGTDLHRQFYVLPH